MDSSLREEPVGAQGSRSLGRCLCRSPFPLVILRILRYFGPLELDPRVVPIGRRQILEGIKPPPAPAQASARAACISGSVGSDAAAVNRLSLAPA